MDGHPGKGHPPAGGNARQSSGRHRSRGTCHLLEAEVERRLYVGCPCRGRWGCPGYGRLMAGRDNCRSACSCCPWVEWSDTVHQTAQLGRHEGRHMGSPWKKQHHGQSVTPTTAPSIMSTHAIV